MSHPEHVGPSSRILATASEDRTNSKSENRSSSTPKLQPSQEAINQASNQGKSGISGKSHTITKQPRIPKISSAVVKAAQLARNPRLDYTNEKKEIANRKAFAQKAAQQFVPKTTRWRPKPPPRNPDNIIQYNKRSDPVLAQQQVQRRQEHQDQRISALNKTILALQQQLFESNRSKSLPEGNKAVTSASESDNNSIPVSVAVDNSKIKLPDQIVPTSNYEVQKELPKKETIQTSSNKSNPDTQVVLKVDKPPDKKDKIDTLIDFEALALEIARRPSTSSGSSSSSSDSDTSNTTTDLDVVSLDAERVSKPVDKSLDWTHDLSDSSHEQKPKTNTSTNSVTESQIAIRTSTSTQAAQAHSQIEELQELARNQARLLQIYALGANQTPPQNPAHWPWQSSNLVPYQVSAPPPAPAPAPAPVIAPVFNIRIDNSGQKRRHKRELTEDEQTRYRQELDSRPMKKGAKKRFKQRIINNNKRFNNRQ